MMTAGNADGDHPGGAFEPDDSKRAVQDGLPLRSSFRIHGINRRNWDE
jgi:hypothetical protein